MFPAAVSRAGVAATSPLRISLTVSPLDARAGSSRSRRLKPASNPVAAALPVAQPWSRCQHASTETKTVDTSVLPDLCPGSRH